MYRKLGFVLVALIFTTSSLANAGTWGFDKVHSDVGFKVKHLMISNVRGSFENFDGSVTYDPGKLSEAQIDVTIDVASVNTANEKRDEHLKGADFFDVANHPKMTFKSKKFKKKADRIKIVGDLTLHGVTKEVVLEVEDLTDPVKGPMGNTRIGATATARIDRQDFGLTWSKTLETGGLVVDNIVKIILEIELMKK